MLVNRKLASDLNYLTTVKNTLEALYEIRKSISGFGKDDERLWHQRFVVRNRTILKNAADFFNLTVPYSLYELNEFISHLEKIRDSVQKTYDSERNRIVKRLTISPSLGLFALYSYAKDKNEKKLSFGL